MTTLARIEANQRNGQLSTGPRTAEGKAAVARNATRHGIFSSVPGITGETPEAWEAHRAGVVESLAPIGLLELNLAERAALLLWRLQRLARYESGTIAAAVESAEVPPLPPPEEDNHFLSPPEQKTRDEQLRDIRRDLRTARRELAEVVPARDFLRSTPEPTSAVPFATAESILEAACSRAEAAERLRADPPEFGGQAVPTEARAGRRRESRDLDDGTDRPRGGPVRRLRRGAPEQFLEAVRAEVEEWAEELARPVRRLERESAAVARLLDGGTAGELASRMLPPDGRDERVAKYERHPHNLLTSTLHELERLRARREGEPVAPPAVADVSVTIDAGAA